MSKFSEKLKHLIKTDTGKSTEEVNTFSIETSSVCKGRRRDIRGWYVRPKCWIRGAYWVTSEWLAHERCLQLPHCRVNHLCSKEPPGARCLRPLGAGSYPAWRARRPALLPGGRGKEVGCQVISGPWVWFRGRQNCQSIKGETTTDPFSSVC